MKGLFLGLERNEFLHERIGDVFEENQAQDDVFIFGGIHIAAQLIRGGPELILKAKAGPRGFRWRRHNYGSLNKSVGFCNTMPVL